MISKKHWDVSLVSLPLKRNTSIFSHADTATPPPPAHNVLPASPSNIPETVQETPRCSEYPECSTCAEDEDCAWCASAGSCMTVSEIFSIDCRGTVFDLPCPDSFVAGERQVVSRPRDSRLLTFRKTTVFWQEVTRSVCCGFRVCLYPYA